MSSGTTSQKKVGGSEQNFFASDSIIKAVKNPTLVHTYTNITYMPYCQYMTSPPYQQSTKQFFNSFQ